MEKVSEVLDKMKRRNIVSEDMHVRVDTLAHGVFVEVFCNVKHKYLHREFFYLPQAQKECADSSDTQCL